MVIATVDPAIEHSFIVPVGFPLASDPPLLKMIVLSRVKEVGMRLEVCWITMAASEPVLRLPLNVESFTVSWPFNEKMAPPASAPLSAAPGLPAPPPFPRVTEFPLNVLLLTVTVPPSLKMVPPNAAPPPPLKELASPAYEPPFPG